MKKRFALFLTASLLVGVLAGCGQSAADSTQDKVGQTQSMYDDPEPLEGMTNIQLSNEGITVDGETISSDESAAVYAANDIVFYLADQGFTYGEGEAEDEHTQEEADAHTVVCITQPGSYAVSGTLSAGQIAIDLGEEAETDPEAVVTLYLNGVNITCDVAPAVIFYNVYECGSTDAETASKDVDTSAAGANVVIVDRTQNIVNGSYVARIYESCTLNEDGTEVVDYKKLHKYDAAFYSKMSMNVDGGEDDTGTLEIYAENEGLDSELHLTINGGNIYIESDNDGINTNEDGISVTTINDGNLTILVNGSTGEGDGIDSNGWLVINGGTVNAVACGFSEDAGIDSDMGIYINGGYVTAAGNMLDQIAGNEQPYVIFMSQEAMEGNKTYTVKNENDAVVGSLNTPNDFRYLIISNPEITEDGTYTLWCDEEQIAEGILGMSGMGGPGMGGPGMGGPGMGGFGGEKGEMPEGMKKPDGEMPEMPEGMEWPDGEMPEMPEGMEWPDGEMPEMPEGMEWPDGEAPEMPEGMEKPEGGMPGNMAQSESTDAS